MKLRIMGEVLFLKGYASLIKIGNIIHCSAWLEGAKWWRTNVAPMPLKSRWLLFMSTFPKCFATLLENDAQDFAC